MVRHNNVVPSLYRKTEWHNYAKTWFNDLEARKTRRRLARQKKAEKTFPRPSAGPLRSVVHRQILNNYMKLRAGKGSSLEELIAVDSAAKELANATQLQGNFMPIEREQPILELVKVTNEMKSFNAYAKLRLERTNERYQGARLKRAAEAEKEDKK